MLKRCFWASHLASKLICGAVHARQGHALHVLCFSLSPPAQPWVPPCFSKLITLSRCASLCIGRFFHSSSFCLCDAASVIGSTAAFLTSYPFFLCSPDHKARAMVLVQAF